MNKFFVSFALVLMLLFAVSLQAQQQFDAALGFGTLTAPSASAGIPSESGGLYVGFSGNVILKHHIGFGGEVLPRPGRAGR